MLVNSTFTKHENLVLDLRNRNRCTCCVALRKGDDVNATHIPIQDCKLRIYSCIDGDKQEMIITSLGGFKPEWNGEVLYVIDWKLDPENQKGRLTYQTRNDVYGPVFDQDFPLVVERYPLKKPNKSKHWTWDKWSDSWRNTRTGERVRVYA